MGYSRPHVKEALLAARRDGKSTEGLMVGDRDTEITLERMGYLPVDQDAVDRRVQDWYVAQGLVVRESDSGDTPESRRGDTPSDTPEDMPERSRVALEAAEAALAAASAALRLARLSA